MKMSRCRRRGFATTPLLRDPSHSLDRLLGDRLAEAWPIRYHALPHVTMGVPSTRSRSPPLSPANPHPNLTPNPNLNPALRWDCSGSSASRSASGTTSSKVRESKSRIKIRSRIRNGTVCLARRGEGERRNPPTRPSPTAALRGGSSPSSAQCAGEPCGPEPSRRGFPAPAPSSRALLKFCVPAAGSGSILAGQK